MTEERVYYTESVSDGDKAKYPYKSEYREPAKEGYDFAGWKYGDTTYKPPYVEANNPFGPINEDTDIKAQWDKLEVYADTNHTLISGTGDTDSDLTNLIYWGESENGKMITNGVTIEDVPLDEGMLPIVFVDKGTSVVNNKNVKKIKVSANDVNITKYYRFKAKSGSMESNVIEIQQAGRDQTVLPDFDFLTFVYNWEETDGKDLDTATFVTGTNIGIINGYYRDKTTNTYVTKTQYDSYSTEKKKNYEPANLEYYPVGYGCNGSSGIDPDYHSGTSTDPTLFNEISQYIKGAGDNLQSGKESALINWKEICNRDFITQGITKIYCELYANWYKLKENGNCTVNFKTWKTASGSGGMKLDRDSSGKTLFTFSPTGDTVAKNTATVSGNVYAFSATNATRRKYSPTGDEMGYYTHVATLVYDIKTKNGLLVNKMGERTGRSIISYGKVNSITYNGENEGRFEVKDVIIESSSYNYTINITELYNLINDTERKDVFIKEEDVEITYYAWGDNSVQTDFVSVTFEKDSSNYVKKIIVSVQMNTSGKRREGDVTLYGKYYADGSYAQQAITFRHQFKQNA